ncbi:MAG: tetratricopeptide repeat protein [Nitrospirae bacterium]|nr:tetratricopeptide repeat protein [Nitrospirota bacterium]
MKENNEIVDFEERISFRIILRIFVVIIAILGCFISYKSGTTVSALALEVNSREVIAEDWFNSGLNYYNEKRFQDAINSFKKAIKFNPKYADAYFNKGSAYCNLGSFQQAIKDFNKAIELDPEITDAYYNRGTAYNRLGNHEQAIKDFNKALELDPELIEAYNNRGNAYKSLGKKEIAIKDYNKALELNPQMSLVYNNRGNVYYSLGNKEQAMKDYNKAIELNPQFVGTYTNFSEFYLTSNKYEESFDILNKAKYKLKTKDDKGTYSYFECIIIKLLNQDTKEAETKFDEAMKSDFDTTWDFDNIENWLKTAKISEDTKKYIKEKTDEFKRHKDLHKKN